ncbi:MAG: hypothetical protein JWM99_2017 [Verrucomicrobiales bacterium]|nr:hypothetical protein [Verrucomicrobiales bacterium]
MSEGDIFKQTKDAYLCLIHPVRQDDAYRKEIASVVALAPSVPKEVVASMITGASWRERLPGICMAMAGRPASFVEPMLQSLRDTRGISIVPACAALAVLARQGIFAMTKTFSEMFDRQVFDGEIGWATDKAMHFAGFRADDVSGHGPNYGQIFDDHIQVYSWIHAA